MRSVPMPSAKDQSLPPHVHCHFCHREVVIGDDFGSAAAQVQSLMLIDGKIIATQRSVPICGDCMAERQRLQEQQQLQSRLIVPGPVMPRATQ